MVSDKTSMAEPKLCSTRFMAGAISSSTLAAHGLSLSA
jgi:hypothetical protein